MTDQIEKWREEFESFIVNKFEVTNPTAEKRRDSGEYFYAHVQLAWLAWCEAKRNMPVVELPDVRGRTVSYREGVDACIESLESAG